MKTSAFLLVTFFVVVEILCALFLSRAFLFPIKYQDEILINAKTYNLSPTLIASVINVESGYDKNAKSKAGAVGLMQILPSTAEYISSIYDIEYTNLYNPKSNIELGSAYLRYLINKFENTNTALASYNAGETIVRSWLNNTNYSNDKKTLKNIPYTETKKYIKKINKNIKIYNSYKIYKY